MSSRPSTEPATAQAPPPIVCHEVGRRFGSTWAVHPLDLVVRGGTVHSVVGENGAGKSTLLGLIGGRLAPTTGSVSINGHRVRGGSAREAQRLGLAVVYQEMMLVPALTALDNVFLGASARRVGLVRTGPMLDRFRDLCRSFGVTIDPGAPAADLPISQQQMLEIFRGIQAGARILVLDEPTAALAELERARLHDAIRRLRADGTAVVLVSHNLDEVMDLSDEISVMRNGRLIRTAPRSEWSRPSLIEHMVGRAVETRRLRTAPPASSGTRLRATGVSVPGILDDVSLSVDAGEIVGLWGLVGSGRTTFLRSLVGLERRSRGTLELDGAPAPWHRSVRMAARQGVVMVPEDRRQGLIMPMSGAANVCIGTAGRRRPVIDTAGESTRAAEGASLFGFARGRIADPVGLLSGGNQQKVLLTKWAQRRPRVMLVDEPTRGIDIGAKAEVLDSLVAMSERGMAVVVTSSDLEEVLAVADRILVFNRGRVADLLTAEDPRFCVEEIVRIGFEQREHAA
jgi:ribose transport system ATP-binding protein/rhamnose transport system ATP-binding protein